MAGVGSAWSFWKTLKEVSPNVIEEEAEAPFRLALTGEAGQTARLRDVLLTAKATPGERLNADEHLTVLADPPDAETAKLFAFILYAGDAGETIGARGPNSVPVVGLPDDVAAGMIAQRPDLAVALARRFPLFRVPASNRLINDTARVNANFALLSALPGVIPVVGVLLPASSVADTLLLTKNQIMLIMRLAAAHGQKPGYTRQIKELLGTIASALGWRTLARELVGFVPAGIGAALKGTIAYSGTFALGRAALWYYQTGRVPSPREIREIYKNKMGDAKKEVAALRQEKK
uniref:DUF697 domain-containing protein n=1 Tax=uncultured Armatimonadetes bacterium TaxID=157466 RepID=A0A6J4JKT9_9BACT|nr:hypothetical protein AVDCRST_MAG63-3596 [uncultured Armatimonadetes bacterium]